MALTSPLKLYRHKTTGTGADKFDEICLDASNFKVTSLNTYLGVYDDVDDSFTQQYRPNNAANGGWNCEAFLFGTGLTVKNKNSSASHQYSFPDHSGTFAMTNDIGLDVLDLREQS